MRIEIPYGKGRQSLRLPEERLRACILPRHEQARQCDQADIVREALLHPIGAPRLCEMARDKRKILVITSDHTRPLPSAITLPLYLEEIRRGSPDADITILIATGMHRAPTPEEMRDRFGEAFVQREKILVHDASDDQAMYYFGRLPSGGDLLLNRLVREADLVVSEGFIEPHFFAGFSGGRKSILPGVASRKTVLYNHNARFIRHPCARQGSIHENPIHRDMDFAAKAAGLAFILNVLLDGDKRIIGAVAGEPELAHSAGCDRCAEMTRVPAVTADIVVTSNGGYPLDQNIYQCVKGLTAAEACVRPGGVVILCAGLGDGHGGSAFYHWFADRDSAKAVARDIEDIPPEQTVPDQWQAQILARVMMKATCIFVTGEENRQTLEDMHLQWAADVNTALDMATWMLGESAAVTVIPDGVGVIMTAPDEGEGE